MPARCTSVLVLLAFALALAAGAEETRKLPEIPDPYGLGPRLALVDYLKDQLHVTVEPGASYEDLVALYWKTVDQPRADAEAEREDRVRQLQFRLKTEFDIDAGGNQDEASLRALIAARERSATVRGSAQPAAGARWLDSYADAVAAARASGRPILIDFTGNDWAEWCQKLHQEVLDRPAFQAWAADHVVLLELDFPRKRALPAATAKQNNDLLRTYSVDGFPTILVIEADGRELGRGGYVEGGVDAWLADLRTQVPRLRD